MSDRLTEIRARLDAATPGPWERDGQMPWVYVMAPHGTFQKRIVGTALQAGKYEDADFIAHAPADIAWLLAEVERARRMARAWKVIAYYREAEAWGAEGHPPPKHYPDEALAHGYKKELRYIDRRARVLRRPTMSWVDERRRFLLAEVERLRADEPVAQGVTKLERP